MSGQRMDGMMNSMGAEAAEDGRRMSQVHEEQSSGAKAHELSAVISARLKSSGTKPDEQQACLVTGRDIGPAVSFVSGHDFSRAASDPKSKEALAPDGCISPQRLPQPRR